MLNILFKIYNLKFKITKRLFISFLALVVIGAPLLYLTVLNQKEAKASWFDDSFGYRQTVEITNSGTAQTDFQVSITLDTATLITAGKMQSDCDDIRVLDNTGKVLPYWIETGTNACNTSTTAIWTKVPSINTTGNTLYLYYGNPSAGSLQNGAQVFEYFDDFSNNTASNYTVPSGSMTVSGGNMNITGVSTGNAVIAPTVQKTLSSYVVEARASLGGPISGAADYLVGTLGFQSSIASTNTGYVAQFGRITTSKVDVEKFTTSHLINSDITFSDSTSYLIKGSYTNASIVSTFQRTTTATSTDTSYTSGSYGLRTYNSNATVDFWFVRKFAATEPTVASPASEETAPGPIAYWKFDEGGGTNSSDSAASRANGALVNMGNSATGGTITNVDGYTIHTFTSSGTFTPNQSGNVEVLVVGGGGGGAWGSPSVMEGGGGGAGGYKYVASQAVTNQAYTVTVGGGGGGGASAQTVGSNGTDSSLGSLVTATGGGGGGSYNLQNGGNGGSGGGAGTNGSAGTGTAGQGNNGGSGGQSTHDCGGGGGGASAVGGNCTAGATSTGGNGGNGTANSISGSSVTYAGGGGGGGDNGGSGGSGGGGAKGVAGTANTGGGGGGGNGGAGQSGGSGIVIIRYFNGWQTEDQCISGKCLKLDGSTTKITASSTVKAVQTVSMWVKPTTLTSTLIDLDGGTHKITVNSSGTITATGFTSPTIYVNGAVSSTLVANTWQYVTVTTGTSFDTSSSLAIGSDGTTYLKGFVDEVKLYNYARSAAQIATDYNSKGSVKGASAQIGSDPQNSSVLNQGLVGYWKLDETATPSLDSSGNSNSGTWAGNAVAAVGKFGNAGSFDGDGDYVSITDPASGVLDFGTGDFSVGLWVNFNDLTNNDNGFIHKDNYSGTTTYNGWLLNIADTGGGVGIETRNITSGSGPDTNVRYATANFSTGTWYHIFAVRQSGVIYLYVNGVQRASGAESSPTDVSNSENVRFASLSASAPQYFAGKIDEVRMYNRALSSTEVSTLYNFAPGPVGYYDFESTTGSTTASDRSGNGYTGTFSGSSNYFTNGKYGKAGNFDGSDTAFAATDKILSTSDFSTSFWVKNGTATQVGDATVISNQEDTNNYGFVFASRTASSNDYNFFYGNGSGSWIGIDLDKFTLPVGTWTHVAFTKSGANTVIYINGVATYSRTQSSATVSFTNSNTMRLGTSPESSIREWNGQLDEVKFYNYTRTAKQIVEDMNAGHPPPGSPVGSAVGHWKFDEGFGTVANNIGIGGTALNGTLSGMSSPATSTSGWTQSGKFGKALFFDGTADWVNLGSSSTFNLAANNFTLCAWFKTTGTEEDIVANGISSNGNYLLMSFSTKLRGHVWYSGNSNTIDSNKVVNDDNWHHGCQVVDDTKIYLYVDGNLDNSAALSGTKSGLTGTGVIGSRTAASASNNFSGTIDEVKIYNSALTADQIKLDMNRSQAQVLGALSDNSSYQVQAANQEYCVPGDTTSCAAPVARWDFEEGTGTSTQDASGNANTGTLTNSPTWSPGKIGKAVNMAGGTEYIDIATRNNLDGTTFTVEGWIYLNDVTATNQWIMWNAKVGSQWGGWGLVINRSTVLGCDVGEICFWISDDTGVQDYPEVTHTLTQNKRWYHIAATWNNTTKTATYYVDGKSIGSIVSTASVIFGASPKTYIGDADDLSYNFNGKIDQLRVFNYVRSAAQIAWDYNKGAPVGHWKMDECQGTTAYDSSTTGSGASNSNTGTITVGGSGTQTAVGTCTGSANTMWKDGATGKYNSSLDFDGTDDYINIPDATILRPTTFTISGWVYTSSTTQSGCVFCKQVGSSFFNSYAFWLNSGNMQVDASNGSSTTSSVDPNDVPSNTWTHYAGVFDGSSTYMYRNGRLVDSDSGALTISYDTNPVVIGADDNDGVAGPDVVFFTGQIDDVKIYNYALTATQVKGLYNGGAVRFGPSTGSP